MINRYASLRQGLVGCWIPSLGASGFRLIDRSGNGNHGTLTNMDPGTDWVPSGGKLALDFDGVNDYVGFGTIDNFDSNKWTIAGWLNASNIASTYARPIVIASDGPTIWKEAGSGNLSIVHSEIIDFAMGITLINYAWSHVVVTRNGSTITAYHNGRQSAQNTSFAVTYTINSSARLGAKTNGTESFNGILDDIRIYNRALTPSEIRLLYTGGRGVGLLPERFKHRRKTTAAGTNRRRRLICGANC